MKQKCEIKNFRFEKKYSHGDQNVFGQISKCFLNVYLIVKIEPLMIG
jgi:hypothetical protein